MKNEIHQEFNNNIHTLNLIDNLELYGSKLLKEKFEYKNEDGKSSIIRIYGTHETMSLLNSKHITQNFQDGTYKIVPKNNDIKVVIIMLGKSKLNSKIELILVACFSEESSEIFTRFYKILKCFYNFVPNYITYNFGLTNLKALEIVYSNDNVIIITCFFHLVHAWWKKASKIGLRRKNYIVGTKMLIFNLELFPFMDYQSSNKFYLKLKELDEFKDDLYSLFFSYFEKTWFTCKNKKSKEKACYPFELWTYYGKLKSNNNLNNEEYFSMKDFEEYVSFTNNFCESLNSYSNFCSYKSKY
jgi:hypothetical protein